MIIPFRGALLVEKVKIRVGLLSGLRRITVAVLEMARSGSIPRDGVKEG